MAKQKPPADDYARLNAAATDEFDLTGAEAPKVVTASPEAVAEAKRIAEAAAGGEIIVISGDATELLRDCHRLLSRLVTGHLIHPTNYDANRHARELLTRLAAAVG